MPQLIILCAMIYDLQNSEIKIIYYTLFIYMIINFYRIIREFIGKSDLLEKDKKLSIYLHFNLKSY